MPDFTFLHKVAQKGIFFSGASLIVSLTAGKAKDFLYFFEKIIFFHHFAKKSGVYILRTRIISNKNQKGKNKMRTAIQLPDEWGKKIDAVAKENGGCSRSAVIRKAIQNYIFAEDKQGKNNETRTENKEHAQE